MKAIEAEAVDPQLTQSVEKKLHEVHGEAQFVLVDHFLCEPGDADDLLQPLLTNVSVLHVRVLRLSTEKSRTCKTLLFLWSSFYL